MSDHVTLGSDEIDELRNESELPHHWALRREFLRNHNGTLSSDRLICLSHVFVNVQCMNLTYPDRVMALVKELGSKIDKKLIEEMTYHVNETERPPERVSMRAPREGFFQYRNNRNFYDQRSNRGRRMYR